MKTFIGLDLRNPEGPTIVLTFANPHRARVGQAVILADQTNRCRTFVTKIVTDLSFEIKTFIRPSRGFARHNRRIKQARRPR